MHENSVKAYTSSANDEAETPQEFFDLLHREFKFTLDVCASSENAKCKNFFGREDDGLHQNWGKNTCWMNPPYGRAIGDWMRKAAEAAIFGATVVCLVPARTNTKWWHQWVMGAATEVRFVLGKLHFIGYNYDALFPSAVVIYQPRGRHVADDQHFTTMRRA